MNTEIQTENIHSYNWSNERNEWDATVERVVEYDHAFFRNAAAAYSYYTGSGELPSKKLSPDAKGSDASNHASYVRQLGEPIADQWGEFGVTVYCHAGPKNPAGAFLPHARFVLATFGADGATVVEVTVDELFKF